MPHALADRLRVEAEKHLALCPMSVADIMEAADTLDALQTALQDLTDQIMAGPLIDDMGHDFRLNDSFVRAVALLERLSSP